MVGCRLNRLRGGLHRVRTLDIREGIVEYTNVHLVVSYLLNYYLIKIITIKNKSTVLIGPSTLS